MHRSSLQSLLHHRASMVPLVATIVGLALGLAIHTTAGATAAGRADHDRPALQHRSLTEHVAEARLRQGGERASRAGRRAIMARPAPVAPSTPAAPEAPAPQVPEETGLRAPANNSRAFAGVEHLTLSLPQGARAVGFHESGSGRALSMHPMGIPRVNGNMTRLSSAPVGDGFEYLVLPSRGRRNGPTSAVDVSMPFNWPVQAPVTGTVVDATSYLLYGNVPDNAVYIVPDSRPDLVLVSMHLNGLKVGAGDRVEAGKTVLALTARQLPFGSQIDRYAGQLPHVHMELRPR